MVPSEKKDETLMFDEDSILVFINCKNISSWISVTVGPERSGTPDSISSVGSSTNHKPSVQSSPAPATPVSHPSAFVSPQPVQGQPQRPTPQQHPGQPNFGQQPMGYQGQQPSYPQQNPGIRLCTSLLTHTALLLLSAFKEKRSSFEW